MNFSNFKEYIKSEKQKDYYKKLAKYLKEEYEKKEYNICPKKEDVFNALKYCDLEDVKVVILGQDPYHGENEAHGLAFSVNKDIKVPPSLKNIYKELQSDIGIYIPDNGYLEKWARQGVILLNSVLTVRQDIPASHKNVGWEEFTDGVIKLINEKGTPVVFLLWGNFAKEKSKYITNPIHLVLQTTHPSPFSANNGFLGSKHFSKTNNFLMENGQTPIDWQIENIYEERI